MIQIVTETVKDDIRKDLLHGQDHIMNHHRRAAHRIGDLGDGIGKAIDFADIVFQHNRF